MENLNRNLIKSICEAYQLGEWKNEATALTGGLLHFTWKIQTSTGFYVIKKINPALRDRKKQFRLSEEIGEILSRSISAIAALKENNDRIFSYENEVFLLFPYKNAAIFTQNAITAFHVKRIASALAHIHRANVQIENAPEVEIFQRESPYWRSVLEKFRNKSPAAHRMLENKIPLLENIHRQYQEIQGILKNNLVISHRDFDPKNVLWDADQQYYLIDWESAGLINKTKDLMATALYWSFDEKHQINKEYFNLFLNTYLKNSSGTNENEKKAGIFGLFGDWLNWLDFNISRVLNYPPENPEHALGLKEMQNTLNALGIVLSQIG